MFSRPWEYSIISRPCCRNSGMWQKEEGNVAWMSDQASMSPTDCKSSFQENNFSKSRACSLSGKVIRIRNICYVMVPIIQHKWNQSQPTFRYVIHSFNKYPCVRLYSRFRRDQGGRRPMASTSDLVEEQTDKWTKYIARSPPSSGGIEIALIPYQASHMPEGEGWGGL